MKYTRNIFITFVALSLSITCIQAQSGFKLALQTITDDLASKLFAKDKSTLVVLYVTDINKSITVTGKYLADGLSINMVNNKNNFQVFDRDNLSSISEAKKLIDEGYIDVDAAKQLGELLSVEVIIVGNYTVLSNTLTLSLKALDSTTGFLVAATMQDLPLDEDAKMLLGISGSIGGNLNTGNRGFNSPLSSNERINNPETVNPSCQKLNTGDFCFENLSQNNYIVKLYDINDFEMSPISLDPNQSQCIYNKKVGTYRYNIIWDKPDGKRHYNYKQGEFSIEQCKSKTFSLK